MRRLEKDEIREWQERLQRPMMPNEMDGKVKALHDILGDHLLMQHGIEFARDAWTAARFAQLRGADTCRLWPECRPDFEMTLNGVTQLFEVVEAYAPGRKRGDAYKKMNTPGQPSLAHYPEDEIKQNASQAPEMIQYAADLKAGPRKSYDSKWGLVIHLNLMTFGEGRDEIEKAMRDATESAGKCFQEVWILWQQRLYLMWSNGAPSNARQRWE